MQLHDYSTLIKIVRGLLALSRTNSGGDVSSTTYLATPTVGAVANAIDLNLCNGPIRASIGAGAVGTSLDAKWQESVDGTTWTDVANGAFTQLTAAGSTTSEHNTRFFSKQYVRVVAILGGTCVFSSTFVYQPRLAE